MLHCNCKLKYVRYMQIFISDATFHILELSSCRICFMVFGTNEYVYLIWSLFMKIKLALQL